MSNSIETPLVRNLHKVSDERDPARRAIAIEAIFDRDCVFPIHAAGTLAIARWTMRPPSRRTHERLSHLGQGKQRLKMTNHRATREKDLHARGLYIRDN